MELDTESTTTSIDDKTEDFCENPTRDTLAEGLMCLLKPTIDQLDERVRATRISQVELKQQIEGLAEELKKISDAQPCPLDLDVYVRKLMNAKLKVTVVSNILQTAQDRLNKVHFAIEKETARRRALLEPSPLPTPASEISTTGLNFFHEVAKMLSSSVKTPLLSHLTDEDYMHVYEPAEDSFLLLDALEMDLNFIRQHKPLVCLEIGSGSGVVSTALSQTFGSGIFCMAVDINQIACHATTRTAKANCVSLEVITGDLVNALRCKELIDLLVFNPPYVPTPSSEVNAPLESPLARAWAGGERGREVMDRLFPLVPDILSDQGLFYLVAVSCNDIPGIQREMRDLGFQSTVVKERRVRGEHLVILRFKKHL